MKGFIVYPDYELLDEKTNVKIFGRLDNGDSFVSINELIPYFFIEEKNLSSCEKDLSSCRVEKTSFKNFQGECVVKVSKSNYRELQDIALQLEKDGITTYEADIKPDNRFLMDHNLLGTLDIEGEYTQADFVSRVYQEPLIRPFDYFPKIKVLSIDLECDESGNLFCIGLYSEGYKECFLIASDKKVKNCILCSSVKDCLEKIAKAIRDFDPDVITGWNFIDFDLKMLHDLYQKNKLPFEWGRSNGSVRLRIESNFFRSSSADIPGRIVLDGLSMIKDPYLKEAPSIKHVEFKSYTLEDVSQAILGKGKLIKGKMRHTEITQMYKQQDYQKLVDYNLLDCELAYELLHKTELLSLAIERSKLTGMPLDRITSSIASFDSLYIREAHRRGLVSRTLSFRRKDSKIQGAYVFSSKPGIYNNVAILDFKSLYPSVIRTFNIDPASFSEDKVEGSIEAPNKVYFKNDEGILPQIIGNLHIAREKAKKEQRELANYAIKTTMNSFWGVLASPNCRYFNFQMASAITSFCRWIIQFTAQKIEEMGYKVIYSDTDSVFVETTLGKKKADELGIEIQEYINDFYRDYIKKNYNRTSYLELEFEKQYVHMMIPKVRVNETKKKQESDQKDTSEKAAKKRYAGLIINKNEEELEIVGLEAIRGDWTDAAQDFQKELLMMVFKHEKVEQFIQDYVKRLLSGKMNSKLIYKKSLRKELKEYTRTTPPHVKAARLLDSLETNIIQYYITLAGPEPIQKLSHKIDYEHYIQKQIKPIANQVLSLINKDFDQIVSNIKQTKLFN